MNIKVLEVASPFGTNCYMLVSDNAAVVIDPGEYLEEIKRFLDINAQKQRLILITHAHCDHIGGAAELREKTGVEIAIGETDAPATSDATLNLSALFGEETITFKPDITLCDGQEFRVGDMEFTALHTPGHTAGSMCYFADNTLFSGDTLFAGTVGRSDFPGGDHNTLMKSVKMIADRFEDEVEVCSGHGPITTIGREKRINPYLNIYEAL